MALYLKTNVRFGSGVFAIVIAVRVVESIYNEISKPCVITSANDSNHSKGSLHYSDSAIDIRTKILSETQKDFVLSEVRTRLNDNYDVLLENRGTDNEHLHIEWDPTIKAIT